MVFKRWASKVTAWQKVNQPKAHFMDPGRKTRLVVVAGNHDLSNTALASAVDLYDRCEFVRIPTVLDLGGASLACLPWAPIHNLVAGRESAERGGAYEQAAEALVAILRDLHGQRTPGKPMLLAAHWAFSDAKLPSGLAVEDLGEVIVPSEMLADFTVTLAGHIHATGWFSPFALYCGSPYPCSFGEPGEHGCWLVDTDRRGENIAEFVPLASRPLVTIDCDLTVPVFEGVWVSDDEHDQWEVDVDETDRLAAACAERFPLTDATIRLRYKCSEEQARRIDLPAIRRLLADAGAHRLAVVEPTVIRQGRARAAGVDESLEPLEALAVWCDANEIPDEKRRALSGLLERWSA